jgi:hypothetical protein
MGSLSALDRGITAGDIHTMDAAMMADSPDVAMLDVAMKDAVQ